MFSKYLHPSSSVTSGTGAPVKAALHSLGQLVGLMQKGRRGTKEVEALTLGSVGALPLL